MNQYIKLFILAIHISLLWSCHNKVTNEVNNSHFDVQLKLNPANHLLSIEGSLQYLVKKDSITELEFNLHNQFNIQRFIVNGNPKFTIDSISKPLPWQLSSNKIVVSLNRSYSNGEIIDIKYSYSGKITDWPAWSANTIGADWIEIGLYLPWYPEFNENFTYKLSVEIPNKYQVFAFGDHSEEGDTQIFETKIPVNDFILIASKDLKIKKSKIQNISITMLNTQLKESTIDSLHKDLEHIFKNYTNWFGPKKNKDLFICISERQKGGGYGRENGIVLGGINDSTYIEKRIAYNKYLSHEIAHIWWHGANSNWEDWLNESFAEYSALMHIRTYNPNEFTSIMDTKSKQSADTPAIWDLKRDNKQAYAVLYSKGPVLLQKLEKKIGEEKFIAICQKRIENKIKTTEGLLNLIEETEGIQTKEWFKNLLMTY